MEEHLSEFEKGLSRNTGKHIKLTMSRIRKIVAGCGMRTLADLTAQSVEAFLLDFQAEEDLGHKTYNHYLQAIESFCNWLVSRRRILANPLVGITRQNTEADVRHQRRALSIDEFEGSSTRPGRAVWKSNGEKRPRASWNPRQEREWYRRFSCCRAAYAHHGTSP